MKHQFNGVQVFSATMHKDRDNLGTKVTEWLQAHPGLEVVDKIVTQSSDQAFHCLAITLFYIDPATRGIRLPEDAPSRRLKFDGKETA